MFFFNLDNLNIVGIPDQTPHETVHETKYILAHTL